MTALTPVMGLLFGPSPTDFFEMVTRPGVAEAVTRASRIREAFATGGWPAAAPLIAEAAHARDWKLLGYPSLAHYAAIELGTRPIPEHKSGTDSRSVYFVQPVGGGLIKIGVAENVPARLATLQIGSPVPLRVIGVIAEIGQPGERAIHERFVAARAQGEWFEPTPALLAYIAEHAS